MESSEDSVVFQLKLDYGIHYPVIEVENICKALAGTKFNELSTDEREINIGENQYLRNVNSDGIETRGIIFSDDMSTQGKEISAPATYCKFDPAELVERETKWSECVEIITDIYDIIIAYYKKKGLSINDIYMGWYAYNCEWYNDDESESDEVPAKSKNAPSKDGKKVPSKDGKKVPSKPNAPSKNGKDAPSTPNTPSKDGKKVPSAPSKGAPSKPNTPSKGAGKGGKK
jgi:hypothetical protein